MRHYNLLGTLQEVERAWGIERRTPGPDRPRTAGFLISLGELHEAQGDKVSAHEKYERSLLILEGKVADTHLDLQRVRENLARLA